MKKFLMLTLVFSILLFTGCGGNPQTGGNTNNEEGDGNTNPPISQKEIECEYSFCKDKAGEDAYTDNNFEINTDLYLKIKFTFNNYKSLDDQVDFRVRVFPSTEVFTTFDYTSGPLKPTKVDNEYNVIGQESGIKKGIEISGMSFIISHDIPRVSYIYVFHIKANAICQNAELEIRFFPENKFNDQKQEKFKQLFNFVEKVNESQGEKNDK